MLLTMLWFWGCKKNAGPEITDLVKGKYLVSGTVSVYSLRPLGPQLDYIYSISNQAFTLTKVNESMLQDVSDTFPDYTYRPQSDTANFYCFSKITSLLWDTIWFYKPDLDSVQIHLFELKNNGISDSYLSGRKVH